MIKRFELGIPAHSKGGAVEATPELLRLLPLPTVVVRRCTGLWPETIRRLRELHGIDVRHGSGRQNAECRRAR